MASSVQYEDALTDMTKVIQEEVMNALLKVDIESACDILHKYLSDPNQLTLDEARRKLLYTEAVKTLYRDNGSIRDKDKGMKYIECLKKLANYSAILLKPQHMRPDNMWETIMRSNHIFEEYISPFPSHSVVLEALGYKLIGHSYAYKKGRATIEQTKEICSDLLVLRAYMEVKLKVPRVRPAELPVRSQVKRDVPLKTPDENSICEICSIPALFYCEDKECEGKAWCNTCNLKWHVNNSRRCKHPIKNIPNAKQPVEQRKPSPVPSTNGIPSPALRRNSSSASSQSNSPQVVAPRPVPAPRRRTSQKMNKVAENLDLSPGQKEVPTYKQEIRNLEILVNKILPSEDMGLFEQRITTIDHAMQELRTKIYKEPAHSFKKGRFNTELIALNKQKERLEERLSELERAKRNCLVNSRVFDPSELYDAEMDVEVSVPAISEDVTLRSVLEASQPSPLTYLKPVAEAEKAGYTMGEIVVGLKNAPFLGLMDWLRNIYPVIKSDVCQAAENAPYMPKLTNAEIRDAIVTHGQQSELNAGNLDTHPILAICQTNRQKVVKSFLEMFNFEDDIEEEEFFEPVAVITEDIVNECICKADGDLVETRRLLNGRVEEKVLEHIWAPVEPVELESVGDDKHPALKNALEIFTTEMSRKTKLMIAMAEFNLSYAEADELIYLMERYYKKDYRQFEVRDAVIALSAVGITPGRLHQHAVRYLSHECSVCTDKFPSHEMANLCCHDTSERDMACCKGCARDQFKVFVESQTVAEFKCPARCGAPGEAIRADQTRATVFFEGLLTVVFPNIQLPAELVTKFTNKLAYWKLSTEPNFHWCPNRGCATDGFGFVDDGNQPKIACPRCGTSIVCRFCLKPWKTEHEGMTCEEFATWERENSDEYIAGVNQRDDFLDMHGVTCPSCNAKFHLARGGCMDCVCRECNHKFCNGCGTQLYIKDCPRNAEFNCALLGMHGHHPRNCHAYLRDFPTDELKQLLQDNEVEFDSGVKGNSCQQMLEGDNDGQFMCNQDEVENEMCNRHYTEYLTAIVNSHKLEVLPLMSINQLVMVLKRGGAECPDQGDTSDEDYTKQLIDKIEEEIPLKDLSAFKIY